MRNNDIKKYKILFIIHYFFLSFLRYFSLNKLKKFLKSIFRNFSWLVFHFSKRLHHYQYSLSNVRNFKKINLYRSNLFLVIFLKKLIFRIVSSI